MVELRKVRLVDAVSGTEEVVTVGDDVTAADIVKDKAEKVGLDGEGLLGSVVISADGRPLDPSEKVGDATEIVIATKPEGGK